MTSERRASCPNSPSRLTHPNHGSVLDRFGAHCVGGNPNKEDHGTKGFSNGHTKFGSVRAAFMALTNVSGIKRKLKLTARTNWRRACLLQIRAPSERQCYLPSPETARGQEGSTGIMTAEALI